MAIDSCKKLDILIKATVPLKCTPLNRHWKNLRVRPMKILGCIHKVIGGFSCKKLVKVINKHQKCIK